MPGEQAPAVEAALLRLRGGDAGGGVAALEAAAEAGSVDAHMALVGVFLRGGGPPRDAQRAYRHLAAAAGSAALPSADLLLAACDRIGVGVDPDPELAWVRLRRALAADHAPSWRTYGALLALGGEGEAAGAALRWAHARGDRYAAHLLGLLALERGAATEAAAWFDRNPGLGVSQRRRASLPSATPWLPPAPTQAPTIAPASPWPLMRPAPSVEDLGGGEVRARMARGVLSRIECDQLVVVAEPSMARSKVVDPVTGASAQGSIRTSRDMSFAGAFPDLVVHEAELRLAALAAHPLERAEPLVSLHYAPGERYAPHHDFHTPAALASPRLRRLGQRVATVVAYLNHVQRGGATAFPHLGIEVAPEEGAALTFRNVGPDGATLADSLHAGQPVLAGEKWIATLWCSDRPVRRELDRPEVEPGSRPQAGAPA